MALFKLLLVFCVIFALSWPCVDGGRSRSSSRGRVTYRTNKGSSSGVGGGTGGGWWSWFRGSSSKGNAATTTTTTGARGASPPSLSHKVSAQSPSRVGFAAYGNNYEANFHHSQANVYANQFRPVSHPYQSHFHPQPTTTAVFAYHFMPSTHVHHIHHYAGGSGSSSQEPVFYDYRNSSLSSTPSENEPIIYDYKPPTRNDSSSSSEEDEPNIGPADPNDVFIAGVENMLLYADMKDNQHQVLFIAQHSDGITFEDELLSKLNHFDANENANLHYFPDVEFRFDADDEPNDDDLQNIYEMYKNLVDDGRC